MNVFSSAAALLFSCQWHMQEITLIPISKIGIILFFFLFLVKYID